LSANKPELSRLSTLDIFEASMRINVTHRVSFVLEKIALKARDNSAAAAISDGMHKIAFSLVAITVA
jgi:hypothetical protein